MTPTLEKPDDFFKAPIVSTVIADVRRQLESERGECFIDATQQRAMEDWSYLNGRVVGSEGPRDE